MAEPQSPPWYDTILRSARIIHGALCAGLVTAAVVLVSLRVQAPPPPRDLPILTYVGLPFTAAILAMSIFLPRLIASVGRRQLRDDIVPPEMTPEAAGDPKLRFRLVYQTCMVLQLAPLEGAGFYWLIAFYLEGQALAIGVAGSLWVIMLLLAPTRDRIDRFVEKQLELVEQEKQGAAG
jgi:hypothetical protein